MRNLVTRESPGRVQRTCDGHCLLSEGDLRKVNVRTKAPFVLVPIPPNTRYPFTTPPEVSWTGEVGRRESKVYWFVLRV